MLHNDGTWDPLPPRKLEQVAVSAPAPAPAKQVDTLDLADSDTEAGAADTEGAKVAPEEEEVVEEDGEDCVITLDRYKHVISVIRSLLPNDRLLADVKNYFYCNF